MSLYIKYKSPTPNNCPWRVGAIDIISYDVVVLKRQNRLKVGTDKPKLKVKMQSESDNDVRKRLLEQPRFELMAKGVFRLGRCYIFWQGVPGLGGSIDAPGF